MIALVAGLLVLTGCRSAPEVNDEPPQRRARVAEMPSPEDLGDNPCGNPDWAKLPPEPVELSDIQGADDADDDVEDADDED